MDERIVADQVDRLGHELPASTPPPDLAQSARARRRNRRLAATSVAGAVVAVTIGLVLTLTGDRPDGLDRVNDVASDPLLDELTPTEGKPCPSLLPHEPGSDGAGFGTSIPARRAPEVLPVDQAWVCRYTADLGAPGEDVNGDYVRWVRDGRTVGLNPGQVTAVTARLENVVPQSVDGCDADLGPRWLLVTAASNDLTGYAVDDFGCRTVRMTDDPTAQEPGLANQPGTVGGALEGGIALVEVLSEAFESVSANEPLLDLLTFRLALKPSGPNGGIASRLTILNNSNTTVVDPGCLTTSNFSFGLAPANAPDADLPGRAITRCAGRQEFPPGYQETVSGPVFDTSGLPSGDYLAAIDFGVNRSERLIAPTSVE